MSVSDEIYCLSLSLIRIWDFLIPDFSFSFSKGSQEAAVRRYKEATSSKEASLSLSLIPVSG